jgi:hypothetical protein
VHRGKNYTESFIYDPATGKEAKIWPPKGAKIKAKDVWGAEPSPDGKLFVGWSSNPRGSWIFSSDGKFQKHIHGGCEVRFAPDGSFVYWVMTAGKFGKATLKGEVQKPLYEIVKIRYDHTYFPNLSRDMRYLIFGACPSDQHNQDTSDYEIFIMKMENLEPVWDLPIRLTYDPGTDRWPDIFIPLDKTPPDPPVYVEAESVGQQIRLMWTRAHDAETKVAWYKVYRGTQDDNEHLIAEVRDTIYVDSSTDARSDYYYKVSAINMAGLESPKSNPASVKTSDPMPLAPVGLYVAPAGSNQLRLLWASNPELDVTGYNVYRSQKIAGKYEKLNSEVVPEPIYFDTPVNNGETYYYQITALDSAGSESHRSVPVSGIPEERVSDGLLAFYRFDEGEGTVIHDYSGVEPPLNLNIKDKDKVQWVGNSSGVEFTGSSMIISDGDADKLFENLRSRKEFSVEVWLSPGNLSQSGPARIVSMSQDSGQRNFTIGQSGPDLAIRLRTTETDNNGIPELDTKKQVLSQRMIHLLTVYDGNIKKIYIDGKLHSESQELAGDFSTWQNYPLIIGNELRDDRTWLGKIFLVAIYARPLSDHDVLQNYRAGT